MREEKLPRMRRRSRAESPPLELPTESGLPRLHGPRIVLSGISMTVRLIKSAAADAASKASAIVMGMSGSGAVVESIRRGKH